MSKTDESSQEYWEKVLTESGLAMERGRPLRLWIDRGTPNERREDIVSYVGTSNNLVGIEEEQYRKKSGRVRPKGHAPD
jgi:hypothetical protein